jgi:hypothetical protein
MAKWHMTVQFRKLLHCVSLTPTTSAVIYTSSELIIHFYMYRVELPEVHTNSPDPVLPVYVQSHNHGITSSKNFSVSTILAFYPFRQFVPAMWLSVIRII